jgi:hypothetical protein
MAKGKTGNHHGTTHPDEQMGRGDTAYNSTSKKIMKKRAASKRRARDKKESQW